MDNNELADMLETVINTLRGSDEDNATIWVECQVCKLFVVVVDKECESEYS